MPARARDDVQERIREFLSSGPWAVVGATRVRSKFGNKVLRCYQQDGRAPLYPIHPKESEIEGLRAYPTLADAPEPVRAVSVITPPAITEGVIEDGAELGIRHWWLQPGAENARVLRRAEELGLELIAGGPCLLVVLGYRE